MQEFIRIVSVDIPKRKLADRAQLKEEVRAGTGAIEIRDARRNNLGGIDVVKRMLFVDQPPHQGFAPL